MLQDFLFEFRHAYDPDEIHVAAFGIAVTGSLDFKNPEIEIIQDRILNEGEVLDIFEWYRLFDFEENPLFEFQVAVSEFAFQVFIIAPAEVGSQSKQPKDENGNTDYGREKNQSYYDINVLFYPGIELSNFDGMCFACHDFCLILRFNVFKVKPHHDLKLLFSIELGED